MIGNMSSEDILKQITDGRTDQIFEYLDLGHSSNSTGTDGTRLIQWCAYYGDVRSLA